MIEITVKEKEFGEYLDFLESLSCSFLNSKVGVIAELGKKLNKFYIFLDKICWALKEGEEICFIYDKEE